MNSQANWSRVPLKYNSFMKGRLGWQNLRAEEYTDEGPFLVTGTHFERDGVDWDACYHVTRERYNLDSAIQLRSGDVLITKDGSISKIAFIRRLPGLATLNSHLLVVRPLCRAYAPRFSYWCLISDLLLDHIELTKTGTTFHGVTQQAVGEFQLPVPPLPTQKAIANYLDEKTAAIDALIEKKRKLLDLLAEERAEQLGIGFARRGDVLLSHKGTIGSVAVLRELDDHLYFMLTPQVTYYRPRGDLLTADYLAFWFEGSSFQTQMSFLAGGGSTRAYLGITAQRELSVVVPPQAEQVNILASIAPRTARIDRVTDGLLSSTQLLQEYRQALNTAAVTGQLDIEAAA